MAELYYIRHCEPNYDNHVDALRELTPKGQADTGLVTAYLRDKGIDMVLSSPFKAGGGHSGAFCQRRGPCGRYHGRPAGTPSGQRVDRRF